MKTWAIIKHYGNEVSVTYFDGTYMDAKRRAFEDNLICPFDFCTIARVFSTFDLL